MQFFMNERLAKTILEADNRLARAADLPDWRELVQMAKDTIAEYERYRTEVCYGCKRTLVNCNCIPY